MKRIDAGWLLAMIFGCGSVAPGALAAPLEPVLALAGKEKAPLLDTLKDLVSIESGSGRSAFKKLFNTFACTPKTRLNAMSIFGLK